MALPKLFQRIFWANNTAPAINASNLNAMSKAIDDIDDRLIALGNDTMELVPELEEMVEKLETMSENPPYIGANGDWYIWNTTTGEYVDSGIDASITVTIADVTTIAYGATPYVTNTGTSTDPVFHLFIPRGSGVSGCSKTGTSGLVDSYRMTFQDGTYFDFNVTNGKSAYDYAVAGGYTGTENDFYLQIGNTKTFADNAAICSMDSEAWAVGTINGSPVASTAPQYHNNSKYYSDIIQGLAPEVMTQTLSAGATSVTFTNTPINPSSGNVLVDIYTDTAGLDYRSVVVSGTSITVTFEAQSSAVLVCLAFRQVS